MKPINLLGLSGSLREQSINSRLLRELTYRSPAGVTLNVYDSLGALPLFNPDLESRPPSTVLAYWSALKSCDGVIIASPEYAHGYTGTIKNALDWCVGEGAFVEKKVAVLNAAPRSSIAVDSLKEVLRTIDAFVVENASLEIPVLGRDLSDPDAFSSPCIESLMGNVFQELVVEIQACSASSGAKE